MFHTYQVTWPMHLNRSAMSPGHRLCPDGMLVFNIAPAATAEDVGTRMSAINVVTVSIFVSCALTSIVWFDLLQLKKQFKGHNRLGNTNDSEKSNLWNVFFRFEHVLIRKRGIQVRRMFLIAPDNDKDNVVFNSINFYEYSVIILYVIFCVVD